MTAEDRRLEIIREARPLPAPAQSAEPPNFRGFRPFCQFRRHPLVGFLRAHANIARRNHQNRLLRRVRQRINLVAAVHRQRAPAKQKKRHVRAQPRGDFQQPRQWHLSLRSVAACRSAPPPRRSTLRPGRAPPEFAFSVAREPRREIRFRCAWLPSPANTRFSGPSGKAGSFDSKRTNVPTRSDVSESSSVSCSEIA